MYNVHTDLLKLPAARKRHIPVVLGSLLSSLGRILLSGDFGSSNFRISTKMAPAFRERIVPVCMQLVSTHYCFLGPAIPVSAWTADGSTPTVHCTNHLKVFHCIVFCVHQLTCSSAHRRIHVNKRPRNETIRLRCFLPICSNNTE